MFDGVQEVVNGTSHLAVINPSSALTLAYRGLPPFDSPQPVRTLAVIPSADDLVFAVNPRIGLNVFEDIVTQKVPLRISTRGAKGHCIHTEIDHVFHAAGFSSQDLISWAGEIRREGGLPTRRQQNSKRLWTVRSMRSSTKADEWVAEVLDAGMQILPLGTCTLDKLKARGFRCSCLAREQFPTLAHDIATVDLSGWPIFVHADLGGELVWRICEALEARKDQIPWQGTGPLPLDRMVNDTPEAPFDVPLHAGAERFWRGRGYII